MDKGMRGDPRIGMTMLIIKFITRVVNILLPRWVDTHIISHLIPDDNQKNR